MRFSLLPIWVAFGLACGVRGSIYMVDHQFYPAGPLPAEFGDDGKEIPPLDYVLNEADRVFWTMTEGGMFGGRDPGSGASPDVPGVSDIQIDLMLNRDRADNDSVLDLVFARADQRHQIGALVTRPDGKQTRVYCCRDHLMDTTGCDKPNRLILQATQDDKGQTVQPPRSIAIDFEKGVQSNDFIFTYYVRRTAIHEVLIADCDERAGPVKMQGSVSFKNPYGYLPGQLYGFLSVYGILGWIYFAVTLIWISVCCKRLEHLLTLHIYVSGLLLLGWIESALYHHSYNSMNFSGRRLCCPLPFNLVMADIFSVLKIVPSKILVLLISMGWGITKPSLGDTTKYIKSFGAIYFWWALAHQLLDSITHKEEVPFLIKAFIMIPVAMMDALLIVWVFTELHRTRSILAVRRQVQKAALYRQFTAVLVIFALAVVSWSGWAITVAARSKQQDTWMSMHWESYFLYGGIPPGGVMWDITYCGLLFAVLVLFYPGVATAGYAYRRGEEEELDSAHVPLARDLEDDSWVDNQDTRASKSEKERA